MEEEKPDEDEEVTVGKNIIHNNFASAEFLSNFQFLLDHSNPFYHLHDRHFPCGLKSALGVGRNADGGSTIGRGHGTKKLLIHLVPSNKSDLYKFLKKKKEQVQNLYGKDETYKYESHISLTGYFSCDNIFIFTKSLYLYLFYYVKLYHLSRKLSVRDLFFCIPYRVGRSACDGRRALWGEERPCRKQWARRDAQDRAQSQSHHPRSQPTTRNVEEKRILTNNDGYVIIPIMCEWLKRIFENFHFLIKNDSFASCRKHTQGGTDKSSRRHLRKRAAVKEEDGHFVGEKDKRYRVEHDQSEDLPMKIHCQGNNATGVISLPVPDECVTSFQNIDTPLAHDDGDESASHSCIKRSKARCSLSSVSTSSSSGDVGQCAAVTQGANKSPALNPSVCEQGDRTRSSGMSRSNIGVRSNRSRWGNRIKYRYNNDKVRLLDCRIKNCNHISLASNRKDQGVQNQIAHMYKDMKYHFSNCTWDMVMYECVEGGRNTHIRGDVTEIEIGNASKNSPRGNNLHLNEIFRLRNFAIS
ncbi:hypothetical protein AK88_04156 [Plasmodium fragile]|uniref:Uncharacterized protein n=1 Tax=Plasmodium fragile TaxID=5857 RepID=A0A0D9QGK7_PLAFR|nr:uncharacterized protein AK88_04156 [Plasmodium fragile]KJP86185.1 hypothetical protein AK88_04156 [Plasmodium fragile]